MKEDQNNATIITVIKLDMWDSLKCLFGRTIKVTTSVVFPEHKGEFKTYNAFSSTEIVKTSTHFVKQDKPNFGYISKADN